MVTRTVELPGDQVEVHAEIGPGRIVRAILVIEEPHGNGNVPSGSYENDPFGKQLDDLLAATEPVTDFADDSREAAYTSDDDLARKSRP